jgi:hypothetical protein
MKTLPELHYENLMYTEMGIDKVKESGMCTEEEAKELKGMIKAFTNRMREVHRNRHLDSDSLTEARNKIDVPMLEDLDYGEGEKLNDDYELYHYSEDDIIVINHSESGEEILQISYSKESVEFESLI